MEEKLAFCENSQYVNIENRIALIAISFMITAYHLGFIFVCFKLGCIHKYLHINLFFIAYHLVMVLVLFKNKDRLDQRYSKLALATVWLNFAYGIYIGIFFNMESSAILFFAFQIIFSVCFIMPKIGFLTMEIVPTIIFVILTFMFKPSNIIVNDSVYALFFCLAAIILNRLNNRNRMQNIRCYENEKLKTALKEAKKADEEKTNFLARMSHEIRTPLNAIVSISDFGIIEKHNEIDIEYFEQINSSSKYLLELINDLLDIKKVESGKLDLKFETMEMGEITETVKTIIVPKALEKNIQLNIEINMFENMHYFSVDKRKIEQILINILGNAVKYTNNYGKIDWNVDFYTDKTGKHFVKHRVEDNGVGMSETFQKNMYKSFSQEDNSLTNVECGTGLGLAITKKLIEIMEGTIKCKSTLNKGTLFEIVIPLTVIAESVIPKKLSKVNDDKQSIMVNRKVLLVEDNNINAKIAIKILEMKNICVERVENGFDAIKKLRKHKYDCILMDIRMPVMDGLTAAKEIRKFDEHTPIIALSANAYDEDVDKSLLAGMNAHLAKPIDRDVLFETIEKVLN